MNIIIYCDTGSTHQHTSHWQWGCELCLYVSHRCHINQLWSISSHFSCPSQVIALCVWCRWRAGEGCQFDSWALQTNWQCKGFDKTSVWVSIYLFCTIERNRHLNHDMSTVWKWWRQCCTGMEGGSSASKCGQNFVSSIFRSFPLTNDNDDDQKKCIGDKLMIMITFCIQISFNQTTKNTAIYSICKG